MQGKNKLLVASGIIVLVALILFAAERVIHSSSVYVTYTSTITAPAVNKSVSVIATQNLSALVLQPFLLSPIPNSSSLYSVSWQDKAPATSIGDSAYIVGPVIYYNYVTEYGLPFIAPYLNTSDNNTYTIPIPTQFQNFTMPVEIDAMVQLVNYSQAIKYFNMSLSNTSGIIYLNAESLPVTRSNYSQIEVYNSTYYSSNGTIVYRAVLEPVAHTLLNNIFTVLFKNGVMISLDVHGILGKYDESYGMSIFHHVTSYYLEHNWTACLNSAVCYNATYKT